jgi:hypothetical protein
MTSRTGLTRYALMCVALAGVLVTTCQASGFGGGRTYTATGPRTVIHAPARRFYGGFGSVASTSTSEHASIPVPVATISQAAAAQVRIVPVPPAWSARRGRIAVIRWYRVR